MPTKLIKNSYNAGELSSYMDGRTDINKYYNGCSKLINATVLTLGGVAKRSGTEFIGKAKQYSAWQAETNYPVGAIVINSDTYYYCHTAHTSGATFAATNWTSEGSSVNGSKSRVLPFEFSVDDVLVLEFGLRYIRFYSSDARVFETAKTIDVVTRDGTNPVKISIAGAHGYTTGDTVKFQDVTGTTELNGNEYVITYVDTDDFTLDGTDSSTFTAWEDAGTSKKIYEIISPFDSDEIFEIHFTQSADVIYIAHEDRHPQKLSRLGDTNWTITDVPFKAGAFLEENTEPSYTLEFTSTAKHDGGAVAALTDSSQAWTVNKYVGRVLYNITQNGFGTITANSTTIITATMDTGDWADDDLYNIDGYFIEGMEGTLEATIATPFQGAVADIGSLWRLKSSMFAGSTTTPDNDTNARPDDLTNAIKIKGDFNFSCSNLDTATYMAKLWRKPLMGDWEEVRSFTGAASYPSTEDDDDVWYCWTENNAAIDGTLTVKNPINIGIVKITAQTDTNTAIVEVVKELQQSKAIAGAAANAVETSVDMARWSEGAWSIYRGYPRTVGFFEDRLWWASSTNNPDTLWSSKTSKYENMDYSDLGLDTDAITAPLIDSEVSQIQWMMARQVMAIGTANKEYRFGAANPDNFLTPSDRKAIPQTGIGSGDIQPVILNDSIFFFQRQGRKLWAMKFDSVTENFVAEDVTLLANTLLESQPVCMAVQRVPDSIIWVVRTDGVLLSFTYEPDEEVKGWARHITQNTGGVDTPAGYFESVAVVHGSVEDDVWVSVRRIIDGVTVRYIEKFATRFFDQLDEAEMLDSAVIVKSAYDAQEIVLASDTVRCNNGLCNSSLCGGVPF